ncbi:CLIP-associating protein 2 isoform X3 [Nilaparvata lugens]|nr:CLIP-associating protein 2 isoform X3 [Nilaparvata lugens]
MSGQAGNGGEDVCDAEAEKKEKMKKPGTSSIRRIPSASKRGVPSTPTPAGAIDEEAFIRAFENVPQLQVFSAREVDDHMTKIRDTISDANQDWEKRVDALKRMRSVVVAGGANFDEFHAQIRLFVPPFQLSLKDLRSQVVREACLTIAYLCRTLGNRVDRFAENLLAHLIGLLLNSAKIMASSGLVCIRFILQYVHNNRLIPIICDHLSKSKSKEIRRACCEFLDLIVHSWPTPPMEKHIATLQAAIKKGIADADSEARFCARKAYWGFKQHFPDQAESLLNSLDNAHKRAVNDHFSASSSSSLASLPVSRTMSAQKSLPRKTVPSRKLSDSGPTSLGAPSTTERVGRTRSRVMGVSQSQPSSRSGSPSSRSGFGSQYYSGHFSDNNQTSSIFDRSRRGSTGIPRSTGTSRENSLTRYYSYDRSTKRGRPSMSDRPPILPSNRPVMAHKMLLKSLEAESALADALNLDASKTPEPGARVSPRKTSYRPFEDHSDDSETSSICSERSFDSYRRHSDTYSWNGSQNRLYEPTLKDIGDIITSCESTHWSDRKEGLVGLQLYLQSGNLLTPPELKRITDNFTKMFMDSHTKVFSLFLDTLNDVILSHRSDLNSWLYVLLTRLLNKLGGDLLGSIQTKIHKSLDVVRSSFPSEVQMSTVLRFLCDATQTPNAKVKIATCDYITKLAVMTDPGLAFPPPSPGRVKDTATAALTKMIGWTMGDSIKQGADLRRAAQEAILALFNLNTPQVTLRLAQLPKEYQDAAASLIKGRVRRSSSGEETLSSPLMSPSPKSPSPTPNQRPPLPRFSSGASKLAHTETENLNPDEVYRSLRQTTAEIQNYSYGGGNNKLDRDTASHDSGISQMSTGGTEGLEERMEDLSLRSSSSSSVRTVRVLTARDCNGVDLVDGEVQPNGVHSTSESEAIRKVIDSLKSPVSGGGDDENCCSALTEAERKAALEQLKRLIRDSSCTAIMDHFKSLLRVLLSQLGNGESAIKTLVLASLTEMMKKESLASSFNNYVELLVLKVLQASKDITKDVQRTAEVCATTIATLLDPGLVIRVLVPLITTGDYPVNLAAVKALTKLVETHGKDPVHSYLNDLMPGLIQAYDSEESSVRKSAVFCMVALHTHVGEEELKPYLSALSNSKLKLLHLYIRRAQQGSSVPTSPKIQSSS